MSAKQQFTDVFTRESATTNRVLRSLPEAKGEFKPYTDARSARELAFSFSVGQGMIAAALSNKWQWPPQMPSAPATYGEVLASFDATSRAAIQALKTAPESRLSEKVPFFTAPKQMGEIPVIDLVWFMLMDGVHHRGQFSTYLRLASEKVPSIYGPSADEPWM